MAVKVWKGKTMSKVLSVDLGGTKIAAALVINKKIVERAQVATPKAPEQLESVLKELLAPFMPEAQVVTVASTGIINKGILTALNPKNLGGLNHFPIQSVIENITQLPTLVINDAQAAAWSEFKLLKTPASNMAFITVSTGVGAGLVLAETLHVGPSGLSGHAGHMLSDPNGPMCGCGRKGCVESIASGTAIAAAGKAFWGDECTGQQVYQYFINGDRDAANIINCSAKSIANLIADLTISLDLDVVILGGSVGLAEGYLELVRNHLDLLPDIYKPRDIGLAQSGADAGLLGAASLYLDKSYFTVN